jgi:hypothetical protein
MPCIALCSGTASTGRRMRRPCPQCTLTNGIGCPAPWKRSQRCDEIVESFFIFGTLHFGHSRQVVHIEMYVLEAP